MIGGLMKINEVDFNLRVKISANPLISFLENLGLDVDTGGDIGRRVRSRLHRVSFQG